jgi:iron complex transport system ATP-binding protein
MGRSPYLGHLMFESPRIWRLQKGNGVDRDPSDFSRSIDELSGGERRGFYARALAQEPEMIFLDEPTSNLDIHHQVEFLDLVLSLNQEKGLTILMASHDLNLASEYCDRLILLQNGKIYKMGPPEEVMTRENIEKVYGCGVWVDRNPVSGMPRVSLLRKGAR